MVAMEVADENAGYARGCDVGKDELALGPLPWIKK